MRLRAENKEYYKKYKAQIGQIGNEIQFKTATLLKYGEERRRRLEAGFRRSPAPIAHYPDRQPLYTDGL